MLFVPEVVAVQVHTHVPVILDTQETAFSQEVAAPVSNSCTRVSTMNLCELVQVQTMMSAFNSCRYQWVYYLSVWLCQSCNMCGYWQQLHLWMPFWLPWGWQEVRQWLFLWVIVAYGWCWKGSVCACVVHDVQPTVKAASSTSSTLMVAVVILAVLFALSLCAVVVLMSAILVWKCK